MKIAIGSDHGGFALKQALVPFLQKPGVEVADVGVFSEEPVDYPDFGAKVARSVARGEVDAGIVLCGTGIGVSIAANKIPGIRAALVTSPEMARLAKEHNNANVLSMGARVIGSALLFPSSTPSCPSLSRWVAAIRLGWTKSPPLRKPISII